MIPARRAAVRLVVPLLLVASAGGGLAAATPGAYAEDAVAGGLVSDDPLFPNQGNTGYDALHYDVDLAVDVTPPLLTGVATTTFTSATTTMQAQTTGAPLASFGMDLQGLTVDSVTVDGVPATFVRDEVTNTSDALLDKHKLIVTPATPVSGAFTTVVTYHGSPVRHTDPDGSFEGWNNSADGATFVNQPVGAMTGFPHNNTPQDLATYTFGIDIPSTITTTLGTNPGSRPAVAVGNGELLSSTPSPDGTRTTWVWDQTRPMASELSLVSIGRFDTYERDLALASGTTLHEWTFVDPSIPTASQSTTQTTRGQLPAILDWLESKLGPYPGRSTGLLTDPVSGITYALETQDRPFFPGGASRTTTIHELTHQWYGNAVVPRTWNDLWISEGTATYVPGWLNFDTGASTTSPETTYFNSWNTTASTSDNWEVAPAAMTDGSQLFDWQVYQRGAMTLEALRGSIGDAAFQQLMRQDIARHLHEARSTEQFIDLAEEISGRDLTAFFQDWVYDTDKPAWVQRWTPSLTAGSATAQPGATVVLTLAAANVGKIALSGAGTAASVATVDLADVLDDADLGTLPSGVSVDGTTLTWTVPTTATGATSTVEVPVVVRAGASDTSLAATLRSQTLGGICSDACATAVAVDSQPISPAPAPAVSGTPQVGRPLTAVTDGWPQDTTFDHQWQVGGQDVAGATGTTYTPDADDAGESITVTVTGHLDHFTDVTRTSDPTAPVARGELVLTPKPTLQGTAKVGRTLTVRPGRHDPGVTLRYEWHAGSATLPIRSAGLTLKPTHRGKRVWAEVTARKPGYVAVTRVTKRSMRVRGRG